MISNNPLKKINNIKLKINIVKSVCKFRSILVVCELILLLALTLFYLGIDWCIICVKPFINGILTVPTLTWKVRKPLMKWNVQYFTVYQVGCSLTHNPEIVAKEEGTEYVYEVVTSGEN